MIYTIIKNFKLDLIYRLKWFNQNIHNMNKKISYTHLKS